MARVGWPHKNGVEKRQNSKLFCKFALKTIDMKDLLHIKHAGDYAAVLGTAVDHPLVNVIHYDELGAIGHNLLRLGVYAIFVQDNFPTDASYGLSRYITSTGSLTAAAPGQIIGKSDDGHRVEYHGWALLFDPEMMRGTAFERNLVDYHFFSYNVNEALRTTDDEKHTLWRLMEMIRTELARQPRTAMADTIVRDYIVLLCDYCRLFYQRQFKAAVKERSDVLSRFQQVLATYYDRQLQHTLGVPSVKYCASELCLSPSYFGDLIRNLTGQSPTQAIQDFLINRAKSLMVGGCTVTQTADALGFEYPQHFTRFFKKHTGIQPSKYVASLKGTPQARRGGGWA